MTKIKKSKENNKQHVLCDYLDKRYKFYRDELSGEFFFEKKNEKEKKEKLDIYALLKELRDNDIMISREFLTDLLSSPTYHIKYNPLKEWLLNLPIVDESDPFVDLMNLILLENPDDYFFALNSLKKWFVSAVKGLFIENYIPKQVLIFRSFKENRGKTSFLQRLLPFEFRRYCAFNPTLKGAGKDSELTLGNSFLVYFDEIDHFFNDRENRVRFKSFASQSFVNLRPAYSIQREYRPRISSFIGTCNSIEFLNEASGKSRFVIISIEGLKNKNYFKKNNIPFKEPDVAETFDFSRVWAEALKLFNANYSASYSEDEMDDLLERNNTYVFSDEVVEVVNEFLSPGEKNTSDFMTGTQLKEYLNNKRPNCVFSTTKLGRVLCELGFLKGAKKQQKKSIHGYWVQKNEAPSPSQKEDKNWGLLSPSSAKKLNFVTES